MQLKKNTENAHINENESTHSEMGPVWQNPIEWSGVSRFLTAQQHNLGYLVPLKVKSEKRESNVTTINKNTLKRENKSVRWFAVCFKLFQLIQSTRNCTTTTQHEYSFISQSMVSSEVSVSRQLIQLVHKKNTKKLNLCTDLNQEALSRL